MNKDRADIIERQLLASAHSVQEELDAHIDNDLVLRSLFDTYKGCHEALLAWRKLRVAAGDRADEET